MTISIPPSTLERLQDMIIDSADMESFLQDLVAYSALVLGDRTIECAVTLQRHGGLATIAYSTDEAKVLDEIQINFGDGPCITAMRTGQAVVVSDTRSDTRWPEYLNTVAKFGFYSLMGVPLELEGEAKAALNFFAPEPDAFTPDAAARANAYAAQASKAMILAMRVASHLETASNLKAAMESRTAIDVAVGIVMAQNRCSQDEAFGILSRASNNQNIKLRDLAEKVTGTVSGSPVETYFQS